VADDDGPWVTPDNAMKKVVYSELKLTGQKNIPASCLSLLSLTVIIMIYGAGVQTSE